MKQITVVFFIMMMFAATQISMAATAVVGEYEDPYGPVVTFNSDGSIKSIKATGEAPLRFGDRRDII